MKINRFSHYINENETETKKGMLVWIYRKAGEQNSPVNVITGKYDKAILIGKNVPEQLSPSEDIPALHLGNIGDHVIANVPNKESDAIYMFSGNFIYTSDSRFRSLTKDGGPIPVHDRMER